MAARTVGGLSVPGPVPTLMLVGRVEADVLSPVHDKERLAQVGLRPSEEGVVWSSS